MSEHIDFILSEKKPKTEIYIVVNKNHQDCLGEIRWHGPWRAYCFFPYKGSLFCVGCMEYINEFINKLMEARKT